MRPNLRPLTGSCEQKQQQEMADGRPSVCSSGYKLDHSPGRLPRVIWADRTTHQSQAVLSSPHHFTPSSVHPLSGRVWKAAFMSRDGDEEHDGMGVKL